MNYFTQKKKNNVILLFYLFPPFVAVGKFMDLGQFYNITLKKKKKKKCLGGDLFSIPKPFDIRVVQLC